MLSIDEKQNYQEAGRIASEVRNAAKSIIKEGMQIFEICERIEKMIREKGGAPSFPCNVCINEVAAHYSSPPNDKKIVPKGAIVKVDIGVHVNGYIADTAMTVSFNSDYDDMIHAAEETIKQAINSIQPRTSTQIIGKVIEKSITQYGFKPIWNLSGHQLSKYVLHAGKSIPNVSRFNLSTKTFLLKGEVYAIEPFLTLPSGSGEVKSIKEAYIYKFNKERSIKDLQIRKLLKYIKINFKTLPFSKRWIHDFSTEEIDLAFKKLLLKKCLIAYPVLVEKKRKVVAQIEHTIVVTRNGCYVTTL